MDALARALFDLSPAGVILFRPVFDAQQVLVDFSYDHLNKPAQQLLDLPEQPTHTLRQRYPQTETTGIFAFYRDTFLSGQAGYYSAADPYDGLDAYYQLAAQRADEQLVVAFAAAIDQPPGNVAAALQLSYQPEPPARAEAKQPPAEPATRPQQRTRPPTEQQALLGLILGQVPAAIATLSGPEHRFSFANAQYQQLVSQRAELGKAVAEVMPELVEQGVISLLDRVYASGEPFLGTEITLMLTQPSGLPTQHYFNFVYQPLLDGQGQTQGILVFVLEVTEQVRARQQVQALNAELTAINHQLTRTNSELDSFVYTASHDLKAPIANLEGLLTALRQDLPADQAATPRVARVLSLMDSAINRFQQTIGHLTDMARLTQDDDTPTEQVDLAALIENVRLDLAPELAETSAELTIEVSACPPVQFAPTHLRSIVYNLLSNALRYRAPGRVPQVHLWATCASGQFVLSVQDNGLGLDAGQQSKLFRLFKRLHTHVQGSGVGLYAVKKVVENAGGTITVQSEAGVGSTFRVALPLAPAALSGQ